MKKTLSMLAIMSAVLVSCTKSEINEDNGNNGNPPDEPVYEISITPKDLTFGAEGGDQSVTVTSSEDWYLDGESDWCEVSTSYGSNGDKVTFSADPYENTAEERTATFTFYCGDKDVELVVTQEAKVYSISVEPKELTFEVEGGEKEITITSSETWSLSEVPEWITLSEEDGENGAVVTVTVGYNNETDTRSGDIVFICGDKDAKVTVTQQADDSPIIQFIDQNFQDALLRVYTVEWNDLEYRVDVDKNNDGQISEKEASIVEILDLKSAVGESSNKIRNIEELKYFTNLKILKFGGVDMSICNITELESLKEFNIENTVKEKVYNLNFNACPSLENINIETHSSSWPYTTFLSSVSITNCPALLKFDIGGVESLESINIKDCSSLIYIDCSNNYLTNNGLIISNCPNIEELDCSGGRYTHSIPTLDLSDCSNLKKLICYRCNIKNLNISKCTALTYLDCRGTSITSLDIKNHKALTYLNCGAYSDYYTTRKNKLTSLDVSGCSALTELNCSENQITTLNLRGCTTLKNLDCTENQITTLDLGESLALEDLSCSNNLLTSLDVTKNTALTYLLCSNNQLTAIELSNNTALKTLYCDDNKLNILDVHNSKSLGRLSISNNPLERLILYTYHILGTSAIYDIEKEYGDIIEYME